MRVIIMGSGGVGGFFGGELARAGHDVTFVARGAHLAALRERGIEFRTGGETFLVQPVKALERPAEAGDGFELALFTVKGYDTATAAELLKPALGPNTAVLTLQNGVDSVEQLSGLLGAERVLAGTTDVFSAIVAPGVIEHTSAYQRVTLGEPSGEVTPRIEAIAAALSESGAEAIISREPVVAIWRKFIILAPNATLTSACGTPVGPMRATPEGVSLYRTLIDEVVAVGRAEGVALPPDTAEESFSRFMALPDGATPSMARDFGLRRRVELEQLTGTLVRRARARGVAVPTFDALYTVLKVRSAAFEA
jgi:2-dehydropantoate 2-reductase